MKIFLFSVWLFLILGQTGCYSQESRFVADKPAPNGPYSYDFGKVRQAEVLRHDFMLKNTSRNTLSIKNITTSCGCTASKIKKDVLLAGESTTIEVSFNSKNYLGPTQQYVYVHTDSLDNPIIKFIIKAEVAKK